MMGCKLGAKEKTPGKQQGRKPVASNRLTQVYHRRLAFFTRITKVIYQRYWIYLQVNWRKSEVSSSGRAERSASLMKSDAFRDTSKRRETKNLIPHHPFFWAKKSCHVLVFYIPCVTRANESPNQASHSNTDTESQERWPTLFLHERSSSRLRNTCGYWSTRTIDAGWWHVGKFFTSPMKKQNDCMILLPFH